MTPTNRHVEHGWRCSRTGQPLGITEVCTTRAGAACPTWMTRGPNLRIAGTSLNHSVLRSGRFGRGWDRTSVGVSATSNRSSTGKRRPHPRARSRSRKLMRGERGRSPFPHPASARASPSLQTRSGRSVSSKKALGGRFFRTCRQPAPVALPGEPRSLRDSRRSERSPRSAQHGGQTGGPRRKRGPQP
jgi:hypothetical protein